MPVMKAALSQTNLANKGELIGYVSGYTFFSKSTDSSEPRRSGVGFAVKNSLRVGRDFEA